MIRSEIVKKVKKLFGYANNNEYWLITGAAMVMYGIRTQTFDIDIGCTKEFFQELQNKGYSVIKKEGYPDRIQIDTYVEVLEGVEVTKIEYIEGLPVSAIADIIEFKKKLNREKDKEDLLRIESYLQHINMRKRRLYDILSYCKKNVPYYKECLENINYMDDICIPLSMLPVVNKQEYIENTNSFLSNEEYENDLVWEFTSGSTGQPLKICKSKRERVIQGWMLQATRRENGLDVGISVMIRFHNYVNEFNNGNTDILKEPVLVNNQIYFPTLYFNSENINKLCELLRPYEKAWFYGTPSQIYKICNLLDRDFPISKITYIELFGEVLFKHHKEQIQSVFRCPIRNMYGCHEIWAIAYECACGNLHILENNVILEVLDKEGNSVGYDQEGEIVLTSLIQKSMPFIRYKIGDRGKIKRSECLCGRTSDVLDLSAARIADDIVLKDGRKISSIIFLHILMLINQEKVIIKQFQVYQRSYRKFEIIIAMSSKKNEKRIESIFYQILNDVLMENLELDFTYLDNIEIDSQSGKLKYFFPLESTVQMKE